MVQTSEAAAVVGWSARAAAQGQAKGETPAFGIVIRPLRGGDAARAADFRRGTPGRIGR
jgi:hypothetical protein